LRIDSKNEIICSIITQKEFIMKTLSVLIAAFFLTVGSAFSGETGSVNLSKSFLLGIRYIKLANTYREAKDFEQAGTFLELGYKMLRKFGKDDFYESYHVAEYYEIKGYLRRDEGESDEAVANWKKAQKIYNEIIKMENGSQVAIDIIIDQYEEPTPLPSGKKNGKTSKVDNKNKDSQELNKLIEENKRLIKRNNELAQQLKDLEGELNDMRQSLAYLQEAVDTLMEQGAAVKGVN
jgi:hypothetical protein